MRPLKIYLADLTHDTIILVSDTIPINIGFIASYAKKLFGREIDVSLFKYPQSLIDSLKADPPDVLALCNYSWNSHLSERMAQLAKEINPAVITVQGGTNFPHTPDQHRDFLLKRPGTDCHVELEGEVSFSNLVSRVLNAQEDGNPVFDRPIDGLVYIEPSSRYSNDPAVIRGSLPERIRDLDDIPSPYLNGMLDQFFDGQFTPFLETNRGCPFKCSFCHTGNDYFQKTNMFSIDRIREELEYIAPKVASRGIVNLMLADTNFAMYPRDREICETLKELHDQHAWPLQVLATTGKNNKERVIDITDIMGRMFSVNMSVQSMDDTVLSNINRDNIRLEHYQRINDHLNQLGRSTKGELILGLPGETKDSFLRGLDQVIEGGVSSVCIYTLMMLHGTEFQNPVYQAKYGIKSKFRIVPLDFGEYDGERVLDYEEVAIETNTMPFDEYLYLRGFALLVEALHNGRPFEEFFRYAISLGVSRTAFLRMVADRIDQAPEPVKKVMTGDMVAHYQIDENYQRLERGEVGGNLIYKYKAMSLIFTNDSWIDFLAEICKEIAAEKLSTDKDIESAKAQIGLLDEFCRKKLSGLLDIHGDLQTTSMSSVYDITGWLQSDEGTPLEHYMCTEPVHYDFVYTEDQLKTLSDQFNRYGSDVNALSKVVTRVANIESLFRKVSTPEGEQTIYVDVDRDRFTRYMLAN